MFFYNHRTQTITKIEVPIPINAQIPSDSTLVLQSDRVPQLAIPYCCVIYHDCDLFEHYVGQADENQIFEGKYDLNHCGLSVFSIGAKSITFHVIYSVASFKQAMQSIEQEERSQNQMPDIFGGYTKAKYQACTVFATNCDLTTKQILELYCALKP